MVIPLDVEARPGDLTQEQLVHVISSRHAGGKALKTGMPKVNLKSFFRQITICISTHEELGNNGD